MEMRRLNLTRASDLGLGLGLGLGLKGMTIQ